MKPNLETTTFDRLRVVIGTILAVGGAVALVFDGVLYSFSKLPLTFAGFLFVLSGMFIAGSNKLAEILSDMMR